MGALAPENTYEFLYSSTVRYNVVHPLIILVYYCDAIHLTSLVPYILVPLPTADSTHVEMDGTLHFSIENLRYAGCLHFEYMIEGISVFDISVKTSENDGTENTLVELASTGKLSFLKVI